jgi:adenosylcobinamide-GDP ribazoletransferase
VARRPPGTQVTALRPLLHAALHELRLLAVALQFLTRVPVHLPHFDPAWLSASTRHFPLVGAAIGAAGAAVLWAAGLWWPAPLAVLLSMAATAWLTGGLHEDGLADTCDGLGGSATREQALRIMKDSRLGSYGALGLALTLALKAAALWSLLLQSALLAAGGLVLAHAASRAAAVALLAGLRYAGDIEQAKARPIAQQARRRDLAAALLWVAALGGALAAAGALPPARVGAALAAAAMVAALCASWFWRRLGGCTGDTLGATQQWSEVAIYLALAAAPLAAAHG